MWADPPARPLSPESKSGGLASPHAAAKIKLPQGNRHAPEAPSLDSVSNKDSNETRDWYSQMLYEAAGRDVAVLPIFLVWVLVVFAALGLAYLAGARGEGQIMPAGAIVSGIYWFSAVPWWLKRQRDS